jgi:hypothetical protein
VRLPTVSVIVPCKNNQRTIGLTVRALLAQDYPRLAEVILVGSPGDMTWTGLGGIRDSRCRIMEYGLPVGRDPNAKRDYGIRRASGELLALVDSDIVMSRHWLTRAVELLGEGRVECVAGGMLSIHDSFWGRYVDANRLGAKTPRLDVSYNVNRDNFGKRGMKPPITANVVFTRRLYDAVPLDVNWIYGYEDYEWFWRIAKAGFDVLYSTGLEGRHHHRRGLRRLGTEYLRSSDGCAQLIKAHPDCPLARKRLLQATLLPVGAVAGVLAAGTVALDGYWVPILASLTSLGMVGMIWEYTKQRSLESLLYPAITSVFASAYIYGLLRGMLRKPTRVAVAVSSVSEITK